MRRYIHGPSTGTPLVWYEGPGTSDKRWLIPDERGSIIAITNASGAVTNVNRYDEYGAPASTNVGRFQYTGQAWLPELQMFYYKARIYAPVLGRFMQTDPTGYDDGPNWYDYVSGDPVNGVDPTGLCTGSLISNADGTCKGGGFTTGIDGLLQSAYKVPSANNAGGGDKSTAAAGASTPRGKSSAQLRAEWERLHGKAWPKDPQTGRNQCAHHCKPLGDGGEDHVRNIKPMTKQDHVRHHQDNGDFKRWGGRSRGGVTRGLGPLGIMSDFFGVLSGRTTIPSRAEVEDEIYRSQNPDGFVCEAGKICAQ